MSLGLIIKIWITNILFRLQVAWDSLTARPESTDEQTYIRSYYPMLRKDLEPFNRAGLKVVEFGGSNQIIRNFLPLADFEIAPNYPEVDLPNLTGYKDNSWDLVILDQIIEHIEDPFRAMAEIHRILKPGGTLAAATPFLVYIHPTPDDYWRFTESGIRKLCAKFSKVEVKS